MPFHGDVRDFGVVVIGAGPAGTTAAELDGVLGYSAGLAEQDIADGAEVSRGERAGPRPCRLASRSGGTCSSLAWFSSVWRSRSIRFR